MVKKATPYRSPDFSQRNLSQKAPFGAANKEFYMRNFILLLLPL